MSMNKLFAAAAALTLFAAAAAQAETVEQIDVVASRTDGCTTVYQNGTSDHGMTVSYVTMSCAKPVTQVAQAPASPVEKVAELH
jgi:hypothetical protein